MKTGNPMINPLGYNILLAIIETGKTGESLSHLARREECMPTYTYVHVYLRKLINEKCVEKLRNPDNGRQAIYRLTNDGKRLFKTLHQARLIIDKTPTGFMKIR